VSIRDREQHRDVTGDPWNGRTLEWSTASPPPAWNFSVLPRVAERDGYWNTKQRAVATTERPARASEYQPIEMPKNSASASSTRSSRSSPGFALIWHIWWIAALGVFGAFVAFLVFAFRDGEEVEIAAETIAQFDRTHQVEVVL